MKLVLGAVPFLIFTAFLVAGIVKAAQPAPHGSVWLLIASVAVFIGLMLKSCLPVKH